MMLQRAAVGVALRLDQLATGLRRIKGWDAADAQRIAAAIHALSRTTSDPPAFEQWLIPRVWDLQGQGAQAALDEIARVERFMPEVAKLVSCGATLPLALDAMVHISGAG